MTEIRVDVDVPHPPERVWRALTDPRVLGEWFLAADLRPVKGARFIIDPAGAVGFDDGPIDAEVIEAEAPHRLVMRWRAPQLHTVVTVAVRGIDDGSRLSLAQQGFVGARGTLRRRVLQRTYATMLGAPLLGALDRLEQRERDHAALAWRRLGSARAVPGSNLRNDGQSLRRIPRQAGAVDVVPARGAPAAAPDAAGARGAVGGRGVGGAVGARGVGGAVGGRGRAVASRAGQRRTAAWRLASGVCFVAAPLLAMVVLTALVDYALGPSVPALHTSPVPVGLAVAPMPGAAPSGAVPLGAVPGPATLSAAYRTGRTVVGGYQGVVTINNLSSTPMDGWTATVQLPPLGLLVDGATGAKYRQNGKVVTFTPVAGTHVVAPGTSVEFRFDVRGVGPPVACLVDHQPCMGLPG